MTKGTAEVALLFQLFYSSFCLLFPQGDPGLPGGVGPAGPKGDKVLKINEFEKYVCVLLFFSPYIYVQGLQIVEMPYFHCSLLQLPPFMLWVIHNAEILI